MMENTSSPHKQLIMTLPDGRKKAFVLKSQEIKLGRDESNNIVINDLSVSRHQATLYYISGEVTIKNNSTKIPLLINNKQCEDGQLNHGDFFEVGKVKFEVNNLTPKNATRKNQISLQENKKVVKKKVLKKIKKSELAAYKNRKNRTNPKGNSSQKKKLVLFAIILLVLGGMFIMPNKPSEKKKSEFKTYTDEDLQVFIDESKERQEALQERKANRSGEEKLDEALVSKHFLKGFRDFQKGFYGRAMTSFRTCLSIDSTHEKSKRYYTLSKKKFDRNIQEHMSIGKKYWHKSMYKRCMSAMRKVKVLINNKNNIRYQQAQELHRECNLLKEEAAG